MPDPDSGRVFGPVERSVARFGARGAEDGPDLERPKQNHSGDLCRQVGELPPRGELLGARLEWHRHGDSGICGRQAHGVLGQRVAPGVRSPRSQG